MMIAASEGANIKSGLEQLGKAWGILPISAAETAHLRRLVQKGCRFDRLDEINTKTKNSCLRFVSGAASPRFAAGFSVNSNGMAGSLLSLLR